MLIFFLGRMNLYHTIKLRRILFLKTLEFSNNGVLRELSLFLKSQSELHKVLLVGTNTIDLTCSAGLIRQIVFSDFADTVFV